MIKISKSILKFYYNGLCSEEFGVWNVSDSDDFITETLISQRSIVEIESNERDESYYQRIKHSPLSFKMRLMFKENLTEKGVRDVCNWLNQEDYKPLYFEGVEHKIYYCMPVESIEIIHNGLIQGYIELTMRCKTYYAETPTYQTYIYDCSKNDTNDKEIVLENKGDLDCTPDIWIKKIGDGGVSIINTSNGGKTLEFSEPKSAKGTLKFSGTLYDEELIKIGDKVYEVDTGDGIVNSHIQKWESEMLYLEGAYVNLEGVIYKCRKSNNDKIFTRSKWETISESNIKVDCSLDARQAKAKLVFNDETIEDGETITIGDINYEFDLDEVYNANNGNVPIDIRNYTTKATGTLKCRSNDDFANSEIQISDKKYKILPTSTDTQIIIDEDLVSWDKFQLDYDYWEKSKLDKICLLLNEKRNNTLDGIRIPYFNEEKNKGANNNIYELYKLTKLNNTASIGLGDTGKFEPVLTPVANQQSGDKLTIFKRDATSIDIDNGYSTNKKFVVPKARMNELVQGGIYNKDLKANEGDIILLAKRVSKSYMKSDKVEYNELIYSKGQFELLRIKEVQETDNGSMIAYHENGTMAYTLETPSTLFMQNPKSNHGEGIKVYGTDVDLINGKKYLLQYSYRFVDTTKMTEEELKNAIVSGDIILGEKGAKGGVAFDVPGAIRLGGKDRYETAEKIRQYSFTIENKYKDYDFMFEIILFKKQDKKITLLNGTNNFSEPYQIKQGTTLEETCTNIEQAINESGIDWVNYSKGTFKNEDVEAKYNKSTNEIILTATEFGADSNKFTTVINDWNFSQKELAKGKLINQFTNKTLTGGANPTWNSIYNGIKLIDVVKNTIYKKQKDDLEFNTSINTIEIKSKKYGIQGNLISVISNCNSCEFKNYSNEFTVTLDDGQDPSIETCINKLVELISKNNSELNVESDIKNNQIKITYKETGKKGNINIDSTCLNAHWDCNKKLIGGENGLIDEEEICIFQDAGEVVSNKNINIIDNFNFEELVLKYGVNRLKIKGNCYLQFNIKYKLL